MLIALGLLLAAGYAWLMDPRQASMPAWLGAHAPVLTSAAGSYLGGFFVGWGARRTLKLTAISAAVALGLISLLVAAGWDGTAAQQWVDSGVTLIGEQVEGVRRYLMALLPSATAAGVGGFLGFRR